jgi:uncharacterized protein YjiK
MKYNFCKKTIQLTDYQLYTIMFLTKKQSLLYILSACVLLQISQSCGPKKQKQHEASSSTSSLPFNLEKPTAQYKLPENLREISGLSAKSATELYCINDEKGNIYLYNTQSQSLSGKYSFGSAADYEGIELADGQVFVLNSNGQVTQLGSNFEYIQTLDLSQKTVTEYEGLAYNPASKTLLLAPKVFAGPLKIYNYNLSSKTSGVFYEFTGQYQQLGKSLRPSGIAVAPNGDVYLLSSGTKQLVVLPQGKAIPQIFGLKPSLFEQPEGICFLPDGSLVIANEGNNKKGRIYIFENTDTED